MDTFDTCQVINELINTNKEHQAREELIKLLDFHEQNKISYTPVLNHLIRRVGLYPYLQLDTSSWQDRFAYESFKADIGKEETVTLHREQSSVLKKLLSGKNIAVSAPTSFGKSFIIDSFIAINNPRNIVIIVPTIALTDETRRRLHHKFSDQYKIITTSDVELAENNIFIFPQERAAHYVDKIESLDILIIDEFYKASPEFDKERSPSLLKAILTLGEKAKQKYFLAPNISTLNNSLFTKDMEFFQIDFNTVYLEKHNLYEHIGKDENIKSNILVRILSETKGKTLVYAGTYSAIDKIANLITDKHPTLENEILINFHDWLIKNYGRNWHLTNLVKRGSGIHNGQLHRSLSQIQVKLFEEDDGLKNIISTSSIIEGVNTSAENIVLWQNKNGVSKLNDFTYKNIIGRGGRMFKHFVGKIYILDKPPESEHTNLELNFPDELLGDIDEENYKKELTPDQIAKIISYKDEMSGILGNEVYQELKEERKLESSNSILIRDIAIDISKNEGDWNGLSYLNSENPEDWDRLLYKIINLQPGAWGVQYRKFVSFIKTLSDNWNKTIPELLYDLDRVDIGVDEFFKLERTVTFKFAAILNDVNLIQQKVFADSKTDISPFVSKISHAFLPKVVYQLEEYGLPRMISKKIHNSGLINFEDPDANLHQTIDTLNQISINGVIESVSDLDSFDIYILNYFFDGISLDNKLMTSSQIN
ncbi:hypothetical protein DV711_15255 [Motiliproteus coralliicola]|uniref:Helicase n=1 Tax=Motiliproteus coralliicola TaxID=2283196 RepID=A0A369WE41_9GAMM|nr:DEAD/DEAH box helicase [Motiliproteus coralliicola]RDE18964.1 hypothetical protein DV711_15255 [Motiliproteus coralliicola]